MLSKTEFHRLMAQRGLIFLSVVSQSICLKFYSAKLVLRRAIEPLALGFDLIKKRAGKWNL